MQTQSLIPAFLALILPAAVVTAQVAPASAVPAAPVESPAAPVATPAVPVKQLSDTSSVDYSDEEIRTVIRNVA